MSSTSVTHDFTTSKGHNFQCLIRILLITRCLTRLRSLTPRSFVLKLDRSPLRSSTSDSCSSTDRSDDFSLLTTNYSFLNSVDRIFFSSSLIFSCSLLAEISFLIQSFAIILIRTFSFRYCVSDIISILSLHLFLSDRDRCHPSPFTIVFICFRFKLLTYPFLERKLRRVLTSLHRSIYILPERFDD